MDRQLSSPGHRDAYYWAPPEGEFSLFDLWDALLRRRWLIVGIAAVVALLAFAYALQKPDVYRYRQVVEVGTRVSNQQVRPIESAESVAAKLNQNYIPEAIQEWVSDHRDSQWRPRVEASVPKGSEIVVLQAEATADRSEDLSTVMRNASAAIQEDHERIIQTIRQQLAVRLAQSRNELAAFESEAERLQARLGRLDDRQALLEQEISDLDGLLNEADRSRQQASIGVAGEAQAMTLLMLTNEVRETRHRLAGLRETLHVNLANQRDNLRSAIADQLRKMESQQSEVEAVETRLENLSQTRALAEPRRSVDQVGMSGKVIAALGVGLGAMLGVFAAFFAEFVQAARRHREEVELQTLQADSDDTPGQAIEAPEEGAAAPQADSRSAWDEDDHPGHSRPPATGTHG